MSKVIRITTVPISLSILLKGQHRFMSQNGFEVIGVSSDGEHLVALSEDEGIRTVVIKMSRKISLFEDILSLWYFFKLCRTERPVIVHSHTPKAGIIGMLGAKLAGVPIRLHTVAGLPLMEATGVRRKILEIVELLTYHCATRIYPNSKGLYNFILKGKFARINKLKFLGQGSSNGIDTSFFNADIFSSAEKEKLRFSLGIDSTDFVFIFVGRLVGDKGINELVSAFQSIVSNEFALSCAINEGESTVHNDVRIYQELVLTLGDSEKVDDPGDGKNIFLNTESSFLEFNSDFLRPEPVLRRPKLLLVGSFEADLDPLHIDTLDAIKSNPNIISVGYQYDVRKYLAISNCLLFPSYREGFPNVVMQAGSMGLPSIVTNINGSNEIIIDGENGMIIPVKNVRELAIGIKKMLTNDQYYFKLSSNARAMIESRYEQVDLWEVLLQEYQDLISQINVR